MAEYSDGFRTVIPMHEQMVISHRARKERSENLFGAELLIQSRRDQDPTNQAYWNLFVHLTFIFFFSSIISEKKGRLVVPTGPFLKQLIN